MPRFFVETHVAGHDIPAVHIVSAADAQAAVEPGRKAGLLTFGSEQCGGGRPSARILSQFEVTRVEVKTFPSGSTVQRELAKAA